MPVQVERGHRVADRLGRVSLEAVERLNAQAQPPGARHHISGNAATAKQERIVGRGPSNSSEHGY
jgi:hypothetical protein